MHGLIVGQEYAHFDGAVAYGDAYKYYVPAGIFYVHGGLPKVNVWQTNPEHPLLAKYIIGFFAVYLHNANLASLLFGFASAVVVFLLARKITSSIAWASVAVVLLASDGINIILSIDPMLDIIMLFFGLFGLYLLLESHETLGFLACGVMFGLSIASKWLGAVFLVAGIVWLLLDRKFKWTAVILTSALVAYLISYAPFILAQGFGAFVSLQLWMLNYLPQKQVVIPNLITPLNRIIGPLFFVSTLNPLYTPFVKIGSYYLSVDIPVNPIIALLPYPVLYLQVRRGLKDKRLQLIALAAGFFIALHALTLDPFEAWLFAPATALTCLLTVNLIVTHHHVRR